jgi:DMSO reductase anchor subunit
MTYEEKNTWIFFLVLVAIFGFYLIWLISQIFSIPTAKIAYAIPMLLTMGIAIVATILGNILIAIAAPKEAHKSDERDKEIGRYGEYSGQFLVNIAGLAVVIMCMLRLNHFWIAHTMYFAFVGASIISSVVKIRSYRQGFYPQ